MRAPQNEAVGTSGETEVLGEFQRMGWAGVCDPRHDVGTDLYLRPRDSRRFELGAVMGAQVKTGPSFFANVEKDAAGEICGWWFRSNQEHFDYWLHHALPHIIVLRDQENGQSYWVHIIYENVKYTNKGAKVLVPRSNVICEEQNEFLSDVALTQLPVPNWDGSAWTGAVNLSPAAEIRHALITPRLVAPHPNFAPYAICGVEALAMQIQLRDEIVQILRPRSNSGTSQKQWTGYTLDEAHNSEEWCWRATAALHAWLYEGERGKLLELSQDTRNSWENAAAVVLACLLYFGENDPDNALEKLDEALVSDNLLPLDHAWLQAHKARSMLENGRHQEAFDLAMKTQRIYREFPHDATAAAIAGASALVAFRATGWMTGDVENVIQKSDNAAAWWRAQVYSYGLAAHLSSTFQNWAEGAIVRVGERDLAHKHLLAAALIASCTADHNGWCSSQSSLGQHLLISSKRDDDPQIIASHLLKLRLAGDSKSLKQATRRTVDEGPVMAARRAARDVIGTLSTRTTALADVELMSTAGDVLEQTQVEELCTWALNTLRSPSRYMERTRPTFVVHFKLIELLKGLLWGVSDESLHSIIDYCLSQDPVVSDGYAQVLARLVHAIPEEAWREDERHRAARRNGDAQFLREAYLAVAAPVTPESTEEILRRARAGDLNILGAIGDLAILPDDAVAGLVNPLRSRIDTLVGDAKRGAFAIGVYDYGYVLTSVGILHPRHACWDQIEKLLATREVMPEQQMGALRILASHGSWLPVPAKERLAPCVDLLRKQDFLVSTSDGGSVRALAAEAFASLTDEVARARVVRELLAGDEAQRASAAHVVERNIDQGYVELLLALAGDRSPGVRDAAVGALTHAVNTGDGGQEIVDVITEHLARGGRSTAAAVVSRLRSDRPCSTLATELVTLLRRHPSSRVRWEAAQVSTI